MAGGTFDKLAGKVRPGTYINFISTVTNVIGISERGIVVIPLLDHDYGPEGEFLELTPAAPDEEFAKLGYSVYDADPNGNMLLLREAMKSASKIFVYRVNGGTKATVTADGLTATAKYKGTRGNKLKYSIVANTVSGYDVTVYLDGSIVSTYEGLATIGDLKAAAANDAFVDFTGTDSTALAANAGASLANGTTGTAASTDVTSFLDKCEYIDWNTMCFACTTSSLQVAVKTKIKYMRESIGKGVLVVMPDATAKDYEGIISVSNSVKLADATLTHAQACAWVAGATAAASYTESLTYRNYDGAIEVVDPKTHAQAVAAINAGEFFFSTSEDGDVVVEYDINSLTSFVDGKDESYRKNRVIRVFDTFAESLQLNFPPNRFDNTDTGWDIMEGLGKTILRQFEDAGAIYNVDYDNDFKVDRSLSWGDKTYFDVGLQAADSAEKLFFTIATR